MKIKTLNKYESTKSNKFPIGGLTAEEKISYTLFTVIAGKIVAAAGINYGFTRLKIEETQLRMRWNRCVFTL